MTDLSPNLETRWLPIRNDSGERIPSFGLVEPTEIVTINRQKFQTVVKPTGNSLPGLMLNSPFPIAKDEFGTATRAFPNFVKFDTTNTPVNGEIWGSVADSFDLTKDQFGFQIIGGASGGVVEVIESPVGLGSECGTLLAGWNPLRTNDVDEPNNAGLGSVTLLSSDEPTIGGTNVVNRAPGMVNKYAWLFNGTTTTFGSVLFANDVPDHLDITKDHYVRYAFNASDLSFATNKALWDMRGGIVHRIHNDGANEIFQIRFFDGTAATFHDYAGLVIEEGLSYAVQFRWKANTQTIHLQVTALTDEAIDAVQTFAVGADPTLPNATGFFIGDSSDGSGTGFRGRIDGLLHYQLFVPECQTKSDFNGGRMRVNPTAEPFQDGEGQIHYRDFTGFTQTTDGSTVDLITIPIPDDTAVAVHFRALAFRDVTDAGVFEGIALFQRRGAGAATLDGFTTTVSVDSIGGTSGIDAAVSGNNGLLQVTGRSSRNLNWHGEAFILSGA